MVEIINKNLPAILGGGPSFKKNLPLVNPDFPSWKSVKPLLKDIYEEEEIFTKGKYLKKFEEKVCKYTNAKHAICVSNCTSGLMLVYSLLGLKGEVILPSFTFMSTGQALMWQKDVTPIFVDVDPETFNVDPQKVEEAITKKTTAIVGVHVYGNPANIDSLEILASDNDIKLIFDAAHSFGSLYKGNPIGIYGDAEIFSCSPTKILIAGEGGIVTTNNDDLARKLIIAREYGNPGNYDSIFNGMNARMSEFNAVMGIKSLKKIDKVVKDRNKRANVLIEMLKELPGIKFQKINEGNVSTYKDFTIVLEKDFVLTRDQLVESLKMENISTKNYYSPALHQQTNFKKIFDKYKNPLPVTEMLVNCAVTLPLSSKFTIDQVEKLALTIQNIYKYRKEIIKKLG